MSGGWLAEKGVMGVLLAFDGSPGVDIVRGVVMLRPPHFAHLRASTSVGEAEVVVPLRLLLLPLRRGLYL